jgi:cyclin-dependent kinase 7
VSFPGALAACMSNRIQVDGSALLGEGTYGKVFKGIDLETNQEVAVKRAKVEMRSAGGVHFTTIREIKIMRHLSHPNLMNLVTIYNEEGDSEEHTSVSLVMPFMHTDLGSIFADRSVVFTMSHVKGIIQQILAGLEYMHSRWFMHRDLKPANVFLDTKTGVCKIGDFGFARTYGTPFAGIHGRKRSFGGHMTAVVCTQWYRAPELFFGSTHYGPGIDIWATGCILCEMLPRQRTIAGRTSSHHRGPLFDAANDAEQLQKIFELMGTPSDDLWPLAKQLPKHYVFTHLPPPPVPWPETLFPESCQAASGSAEFIQSLLAMDPSDRVSAKEALESEYLASDIAPRPASARVIASLVQGRYRQK